MLTGGVTVIALFYSWRISESQEENAFSINHSGNGSSPIQMPIGSLHELIPLNWVVEKKKGNCFVVWRISICEFTNQLLLLSIDLLDKVKTKLDSELLFWEENPVHICWNITINQHRLPPTQSSLTFFWPSNVGSCHINRTGKCRRRNTSNNQTNPYRSKNSKPKEASKPLNWIAFVRSWLKKKGS